MSKYPEKMRRSKKRPSEEIAQHVSRTGKVKKRMKQEHAQALAGQTGMNAYRCPVCSGWHVGRTRDQMRSDGFRKGRNHQR